MTKQEFIELWRHELGGMVLDASTYVADSAGRSLFLRNAMRRIDAHLGKIHDQLAPLPPKEPPPPKR